MHTRKFNIEGRTIHIHYNPDFSGEAIVNWGEADTFKEIEVPGFVLRAMMQLSKEGLAAELIAFLEDV